MKVLIVDDHEEYLQMICEYLRRINGYKQIKISRRGDDGFDTAESFCPEIIILDMTLPDMNGIELARELRKTIPEVGIIMVTGHDPSGHRTAALAAGVDEFIPKMDIFSELIPAIDKLLGNS